jgi:hypothetical protein
MEQKSEKKEAYDITIQGIDMLIEYLRELKNQHVRRLYSKPRIVKQIQESNWSINCYRGGAVNDWLDDTMVLPAQEGEQGLRLS